MVQRMYLVLLTTTFNTPHYLPLPNDVAFRTITMHVQCQVLCVPIRLSRPPSYPLSMHLLRADTVVDQEIIERRNAPSTRAKLSYISSLVTTPVIKTYSTRASSSATKSRGNARGSENDRGADAGSGSYDGSALEQIAVVSLDGEANGFSDILLLAADQGVGRGGGQGGEGGDGDGGETHVDGAWGWFWKDWGW
jgi:hypothetical protein